MRKSFKYRIYPTREQEDVLNYQLREACDLYNCALEERKGAWKLCRKFVTYYDQSHQLKTMRAEGLIGLPNFSCSQDVLRRLNKAFQDFFRRVRRGDKPGFPRFKPSRRWSTLVFPSYGDGCKLREKKVYIHGVGEIKVKLHRPVEGKIKTVSIKREAGRWFVIFSVEYDPISLPISTETVGLDLGISTFVTLSDGSEIDNPRFLSQAEKKIRIANRRLARRSNKRSNRRRESVIMLQRAYAHMRYQRADFHHKVARMLVNRYGLIAVENLNIKGMYPNLSKSVNDAGWGLFLKKLAYKAENAGREFIKVNSRGTSQFCLCGERVAKVLKERWHSCPICGLESGRDHVSAQIILARGLRVRNVTWPEVRASVLREAVAT